MTPNVSVMQAQHLRNDEVRMNYLLALSPYKSVIPGCREALLIHKFASSRDGRALRGPRRMNAPDRRPPTSGLSEVRITSAQVGYSRLAMARAKRRERLKATIQRMSFLI